MAKAKVNPVVESEFTQVVVDETTVADVDPSVPTEMTEEQVEIEVATGTTYEFSVGGSTHMRTDF